MSKGQRTAAKIFLAILLPLLTYWSTVNLPLDGASWWTPVNNFLWIASAVFFVLYLPLRGLGTRNWVFRVIVALVAVAMITTGFQAAVKYRAQQTEQK
ncbi:MAG TPA: hypothetical protein VD902_17510 [Symbiobacteriaceae bacterium]|nr:hypothetical protein [Symbiobacteriaceae bacterium]